MFIRKIYNFPKVDFKAARFVFKEGPSEWPKVEFPSEGQFDKPVEGLKYSKKERERVAAEVANLGRLPDIFKQFEGRVKMDEDTSVLPALVWKTSPNGRPMTWDKVKQAAENGDLDMDDVKMYTYSAKEKNVKRFYLTNYVDVALLQSWLVKAGFGKNLKISGKYDSGTKEAVAEFQSHMKFGEKEQDGQFGPQTFAAMKAFMKEDDGMGEPAVGKDRISGEDTVVIEGRNAREAVLGKEAKPSYEEVDETLATHERMKERSERMKEYPKHWKEYLTYLAESTPKELKQRVNVILQPDILTALSGNKIAYKSAVPVFKYSVNDRVYFFQVSMDGNKYQFVNDFNKLLDEVIGYNVKEEKYAHEPLGPLPEGVHVSYDLKKLTAEQSLEKALLEL